MSVEQLAGLTFPLRNTVRANPVATEKQHAFISSLLREREAPETLRSQAFDPALSTTAATDLIDQLKKCPRAQQPHGSEPRQTAPPQSRGIAFIPDHAEPPF